MFWVLALLSVTAYTLHDVPCADTYWHLAAGREILNQGQLLQTDPFSFTAGQAHWFNHEWLAEVLFAVVHRFGGWYALYGLRALLVGAAFVLLPLWGRRPHLLLSLLPVAMLKLGQAYFFLDLRAYLFSYLFCSATLLLLRLYLDSDQARFLWMGAALVLPWANCHGGYILGPVVWGIAGFSLLTLRDPRWKLLWATCFAGMLAALLNPYGAHIWAFPFSLGQFPLYAQHLNEWQPPRLLGPGYLYLALPPLAGWLLWRAGAARWEWLLAIAFLGLGFTTWRHGVLAGLVLTHLLADKVPEIKSHQRAAGAVFLLLFSGWLGLRLQGGPEQWGRGGWFPQDAVHYLKQHPELPERLMHPYEWGGYLAWTLGPEARTFIDGRAHTLFPEQLYLDWMAAQFGAYQSEHPHLQSKTAPQVLDEYQLDLVLASRIQGNLATSLEAQPGWAMLYSDRVSALFLRTSGPVGERLASRLSNPDQVLAVAKTIEGSEAELELLSHTLTRWPEQNLIRVRLGWALFQKARYEPAVEALEQALEQDPGQKIARQVLAEIALAQGKKGEALRWLEEEQKLNPNARTLQMLEKLRSGSR